MEGAGEGFGQGSEADVALIRSIAEPALYPDAVFRDQGGGKALGA
jgi:hypothetical protein